VDSGCGPGGRGFESRRSPLERACKQALSHSAPSRLRAHGANAGKFLLSIGGLLGKPAAIRAMARAKRANGAGSIYIKHGAYYGRWVTLEGGMANRKPEAGAQPASHSRMRAGQLARSAESTLGSTALDLVAQNNTGPWWSLRLKSAAADLALYVVSRCVDPQGARSRIAAWPDSVTRP
jgi:hypothetical protein